MNIFIEEVFFHDDVRGGHSIGFQTYGLDPIGESIGVIAKRPLIDLNSKIVTIKGYEHILIPDAPESPWLTAYHLRTIADRLANHNDRQKKD